MASLSPVLRASRDGPPTRGLSLKPQHLLHQSQVITPIKGKIAVIKETKQRV